jgi:hypothetical protein
MSVQQAFLDAADAVIAKLAKEAAKIYLATHNASLAINMLEHAFSGNGQSVYFTSSDFFSQEILKTSWYSNTILDEIRRADTKGKTTVNSGSSSDFGFY